MTDDFYNKTFELARTVQKILKPHFNSLAYGNIRSVCEWTNFGIVPEMSEQLKELGDNIGIERFNLDEIIKPIGFVPINFELQILYDHDLLSTGGIVYHGKLPFDFLKNLKEKLSIDKLIVDVEKTVSGIPERRKKYIIGHVKEQFENGILFEKFVREYAERYNRSIDQILTPEELSYALAFEKKLKLGVV